jgi:hypothetical protein
LMTQHRAHVDERLLSGMAAGAATDQCPTNAGLSIAALESAARQVLDIVHENFALRRSCCVYRGDQPETTRRRARMLADRDFGAGWRRRLRFPTRSAPEYSKSIGLLFFLAETILSGGAASLAGGELFHLRSGQRSVRYRPCEC